MELTLRRKEKAAPRAIVSPDHDPEVIAVDKVINGKRAALQSAGTRLQEETARLQEIETAAAELDVRKELGETTDAEAEASRKAVSDQLRTIAELRAEVDRVGATLKVLADRRATAYRQATARTEAQGRAMLEAKLREVAPAIEKAIRLNVELYTLQRDLGTAGYSMKDYPLHMVHLLDDPLPDGKHPNSTEVQQWRQRLRHFRYID